MNVKKYRMPNGTWVTDPVKMSKSWERIYKPICKELGVTVIGFDPGILFKQGNHCFDLNTDLAIKFRDLIQENKRLKKELNKYYE